MNPTDLEHLFDRFRRHGDANALAGVFDRTAPELGRVATYLAGGDGHRACDLLQATWLAAITSAVTWDAQRPLLPWLLGILANHARSQQRASRRAMAGAGAEALGTLLASDDPVRASEDREFARLLAGALAELPPPFREAVTLHVQHGLTAKEIGEALGRPAGTVRTQIVRGLDRLRQLLPAGLAGAGVAAVGLSVQQLARVRDAVTAALPAPATPFAAARAWSLALLAAALLAVAVSGLWRDEAPPAEEEVPTATAASAAVADGADDRGARTERELPPQEPRPLAAPRPVRRITVHVRREAEPKVVAGEWVVLACGEGRLASTNAAGDAVFDDVPPALFWSLYLSGCQASEHLPSPRLPPPDTFDREVTMLVEGGAPLAVRVVDAGGLPVAGAEVDGNGMQALGRTWWPLGRTDANGELLLRNQRLAQYRARAAGHATSTFASPESAAAGVTLTLGAAIAPLAARVLDVDGKPIAAEVATYEFGNGTMAPWYDRTDAGGGFTFDWLGAGNVAIVARVADGKGMRIGIARLDVPKREAVDVRLQPAASLVVSATFADGRAAPRTMVRGRLLADGAFELPFCRPQLATGDDGRLLVDGLAPGRWHFEVDFGQASVKRVFDLAAGAEATWDAPAVALQQLQLRVLDERGAPLAKWSVHVLDAKQQAVGGQSWTTDSGELWHGMKLLLPPNEPFTLVMHESVIDGGNFLFPAHKVPGVVADGTRIDVVVPDRCRTTHRVRGRLVDAQGLPVAGSVQVVSPLYPWQGETAATTADGAFTIGPLPSGRYPAEVRRHGKPPFRLGRIEIPFAGDLELGDVVLAAEVCVRARPADRASVPPDVRLELVREGSGERYDFERADDGQFASEEVPPGRYVLRGSGRTHLVGSQLLTVGASDLAVTFRIEAAPTLRVEIPLRDDERAQAGWSGTVTLRRGGEDVVRRDVRTSFRGRVPTPLTVQVAAPPGEYTVVVGFYGHYEVRGTCVLDAAGSTLQLVR